MREVGVEGRWRPLGRGRVGDAVSGGRRRHEGAPEGWSAGAPALRKLGPRRSGKRGFGGKTLCFCAAEQATALALWPLRTGASLGDPIEARSLASVVLVSAAARRWRQARPR